MVRMVFILRIARLLATLKQVFKLQLITQCFMVESIKELLRRLMALLF